MYVPMPITDIALPLRHGMLYKKSVASVTKMLDHYNATAIDYDKNSATTRRFYVAVQNKMHYAVYGYTAAELIV